MMAANRKEYAQLMDADGLIFDWRSPRSSSFGKIGLYVLAAGVLMLPLTVVRIHLDQQPVQESQEAVMMMLTPGNDSMQWLEVARDHGPFPTRFDPAGWDAWQATVDEVLDGLRSGSMPPHVPQFLDYPSEGSPPIVPLVSKGSRVLPRVAPPEFESLESIHVRSLPVLYPLSAGKDELPSASPEFDGEVSPEMAYLPWRFLLQVSPEGVVRNAVALVGHNTPGRPVLVDWLRSHRFPVTDQANDRWVAVAVNFQNQPANGAVDP